MQQNEAGRTQCQDEFRNSSGTTQNLKSPETPKERYRQVTILDLESRLDDIQVVWMQNIGWLVGLLFGWTQKTRETKMLITQNFDMV